MNRDRDRTPRVETNDAILEWERAPATVADGPPVEDLPELDVEPDPEPGHPTPPRGVEILPGWEPGFESGQLFGIKLTVHEVQDVLLEHGFETETAVIVTTALRRRLNLPVY